MPTFRYVARTMEGESSTGTISAPALREALEQLRAQDLFVISIREHGAGLQRREASLDQLFARVREKKPKNRDYMVFCRQFATMLQAGITVLQILKIQAQQSENPSLREKLREVALEVERGGTWPGPWPSTATSSQAYYQHGRGRRDGGILDAVMERLAIHFQNQHDLERRSARRRCPSSSPAWPWW